MLACAVCAGHTIMSGGLVTGTALPSGAGLTIQTNMTLSSGVYLGADTKLACASLCVFT